MKRFHVFTLATLFLLLNSTAWASVHLMQIERVIAGVDGDTSAQAVQLRMRSAFQNQTQLARLVAYDAAGLNPVILSAPSTTVPNSSAGDRILFCTSAFAADTDPTAAPDFTMVPIPSSYLASGSLTWESTTGSIYWRLSWGGSSYTGDTTGTTFNDADGQFAPGYASALPSAGTVALSFLGTATDLSTNNANDYALTADNAEFTNNAGNVFTVQSTVTAVESLPSLATGVEMQPAFPNPFNPRTSVRFDLAEASRVSLKVYDLDGRLVDVLFNGVQSSGPQLRSWAGTDLQGHSVASGVYLIRLEAEDGSVASQRVTLLK